MKHFKSILALTLALVMVISCIGNAFAVKASDLQTKTLEEFEIKLSEDIEIQKGFRGEAFMKLNSYQYADDEIVRAIVILEGECEADVADAGSEKAAAHRVKLANQHNNVRKAMSGIKYEMQYDFTRLLNGFSCDVAYGDLEAIAAIEGVVAVHIANTYDVPEVIKEEDPKMSFANEMTGNVDAVNRIGANGAGIIVAVLDTGLALDHEAFQDDMGLAAESAVLTKEMVEAAELHGKGAYVSAKVPFAYDYADKDDDPTDKNGHGTHVSGIAVGYATTQYEDGGYTVDFCGAAPAAQLLAMKIFKDAGKGTSSDIYFYALEDAYELGADVINMSIGAQNGFTYDSELETEVFGNIYKRLEAAGVVMSVAAGNEYSMAEFSSMGYIGAEYTDYGTVASPATYEGNVSIASVENVSYPSYNTLQTGGRTFEYIDSSKEEKDSWRGNFGGKTLDYVLVPGTGVYGVSLGLPEDFAAIDVKDKIAIIVRGELDFETKVENAYKAGAIGCIVVNNQAGRISMAIETFEIPAITLTMDALDLFDSFPIGTLTVPDGAVYVPNENGYLMSDFSNWGTSPDLTLDPALTSVGGMVYSSVPGGTDTYDVYSGTSMAAPNATGTFANILTAIYAKYPDMEKAEAAELAKDLLISTAYILYDADGYLYSPRKQGAGLAQITLALEAMDAAYISNPLVELGDDAEKTGVYKFDVELVNNSDKDQQYYVDGITMIDWIANLNTEESPIYGNSLTSDYLWDTAISFNNEDAAKCFYDMFIDCEDDWYHSYVDYMVYNGYMNGISANKFDPNGSLTRAMAVTVLYRIAGEPEVEAPATFTDVAEGLWYSDAIAWAQSNGIVNGVSETEFAPDQNVTREQIATILWRVCGEEEATDDLSDFNDAANISEYAKTAVAWAVEWGLMQGDNDKNMNPQDNATRAEFAAIMTRFMGEEYQCGEICVIVPANGKKTVTIEIALAEEDKAYLDETFENGTYIEGFIEFSNPNNYVHATYLAYYGDWTQANVLEAADFRDIIDAEAWLNSTVADAEGNTYADLGYTYADLLTFYTSPNNALLADSALTEAYAYAGGSMLDPTVTFNEKHIAFSTPETDGTWNYAEILYMTPYQLRNLEHLIMTISNKETGEVYMVDDTQYLPKAIYDEENQAWANTGVFYWDGKDANGEYVPSGTVATITYDAVLPYNDTEVKGVWGFDVTVDYTAPVVESAEYDAETGLITVTASDEQYLQGIYLSDADYNVLDIASFSSDEQGASFTATFDVSDYVEAGYTSLWVVALDFATNEMEQEVSLIETGMEATITFKTPLGEETVLATTGETITFEAPEAPEGYNFAAWVTEEVEEAAYEDVLYMEQYCAGEEFLVVATEYTFYALYAVGGEGEVSKNCYYWDYTSDYTGKWAICGWNMLEDGSDYDKLNPKVLSTDLKTLVAADIADVEMGTEYAEFYTNSADLAWTITSVGTNVYTLQDAAGRYLTLDANGNLSFSASLDSYYCFWAMISFNDGTVACFNYQNQNAYLTYDWVEEDFALMDRSQPVYGTEYTPDQVFALSMYALELGTSDADYYTTK